LDFEGVDRGNIVHELEASVDLEEGLSGDDEAIGVVVEFCS